MIKPSVSVMLSSAECLAEQVDAVLTMWLELCKDKDESAALGALVTINHETLKTIRAAMLEVAA
ncbi:hypothetical protein ACQDL3_003963 [Yersinia enterocolitica]